MSRPNDSFIAGGRGVDDSLAYLARGLESEPGPYTSTMVASTPMAMRTAAPFDLDDGVLTTPGPSRARQPQANSPSVMEQKEANSRLMKENMDLKLRIHYYEERLAEFRSDTNMDAEILLNQQRAEVNRLNILLKERENLLSQAKTTLQVLRNGEMVGLKDSLANAGREIERLTAHSEQMETKLMNSHSNSDRLNEEVIELKRQLEAAADDNAQNMSQILTSANEATSARSEISQMQQQFEQRERENEQAMQRKMDEIVQQFTAREDELSTALLEVTKKYEKSAVSSVNEMSQMQQQFEQQDRDKEQTLQRQLEQQERQFEQRERQYTQQFEQRERENEQAMQRKMDEVVQQFTAREDELSTALLEVTKKYEKSAASTVNEMSQMQQQFERQDRDKEQTLQRQLEQQERQFEQRERQYTQQLEQLEREKEQLLQRQLEQQERQFEQKERQNTQQFENRERENEQALQRRMDELSKQFTAREEELIEQKDRQTEKRERQFDQQIEQINRQHELQIDQLTRQADHREKQFEQQERQFEQRERQYTQQFEQRERENEQAMQRKLDEIALQFTAREDELTNVLMEANKKLEQTVQNQSTIEIEQTGTQKQISQMKEEIQSRDEKIQSLGRYTADLESRNRQLKREFEMENQRVKTEVGQLQLDFEARTGASAAKSAEELKAQRETFKTELETLRSENEKLSALATTKSANTVNETEARERLQRESKQTSTELEELKEKYRAVYNDNYHLSAEVKRLRITIQSRDQSLEEASAKLHQSRQAIEDSVIRQLQDTAQAVRAHDKYLDPNYEHYAKPAPPMPQAHEPLRVPDFGRSVSPLQDRRSMSPPPRPNPLEPSESNMSILGRMKDERHEALDALAQKVSELDAELAPRNPVPYAPELRPAPQSQPQPQPQNYYMKHPPAPAPQSLASSQRSMYSDSFAQPTPGMSVRAHYAPSPAITYDSRMSRDIRDYEMPEDRRVTFSSRPQEPTKPSLPTSRHPGIVAPTLQGMDRSPVPEPLRSMHPHPPQTPDPRTTDPRRVYSDLHNNLLDTLNSATRTLEKTQHYHQKRSNL